MTLQVSHNGRFLVHNDGTPFFYLGDTAWELFHRLTREEAEFYLQTRAAQGFTVIEAVVLAEHGYDVPNPYGDLPLQDNDPLRPVEGYFQHVDWIVRRANALGMVVGMLPTWGDKWNVGWGAGPEIFTPENARAYGQYVGRRYADDNVLWILGGDRAVETEAQRAVIEAMAAGLAEGDGGVHLKTFHPPGGHSSSEYFPNAPWLDFHQWQSGHSRNVANYGLIAQDYARLPIKPVMDGEPAYEDHPADFDWNVDGATARHGYMDDYDVRKTAYWALFAGSFGHTYGCHDVWQFLDTSRFPAVTVARTPWREALQLPGANQVRYVRALIESRPFLTRIPDQSLLLSDASTGTDHVQATRDSDGTYAFVYSASGQAFTLDLSQLTGDTLRAWWYDPRTGTASALGEFSRTETHEFQPPTSGEGQDWILVVDDSARNFPPPGRKI